jgi:hypothetical protein
MFRLASVTIQRISAKCMEVAALKGRVFLCLVTKMSDRFLQSQLNNKFCVKFGTNTSDTCAMSSEAYGGENMKNLNVLSCIHGSKWIVRTWKMMKEVAITFFDITDSVQFEFIPQGHTVLKFIIRK